MPPDRHLAPALGGRGPSAKALAHWLTDRACPLTLAARPLGVLLNLRGRPMVAGADARPRHPRLSVIGTFGAALTVGIRRGGLLLSLLVLPLYVPP
jgi:heme exporter protein B